MTFLDEARRRECEAVASKYQSDIHTSNFDLAKGIGILHVNGNACEITIWTDERERNNRVADGEQIFDRGRPTRTAMVIAGIVCLIFLGLAVAGHALFSAGFASFCLFACAGTGAMLISLFIATLYQSCQIEPIYIEFEQQHALAAMKTRTECLEDLSSLDESKRKEFAEFVATTYGDEKYNHIGARDKCRQRADKLKPDRGDSKRS